MTVRPGRLVLLGHPVHHSLSPTFQNAALRSAALPLRYEALDVAPHALDDVLAQLVTARAAGNVTIPHKEHVAAACARVSPIAARAGAVNTFWTENGALVGDNTDAPGFLELLSHTAGDARANGSIALLGAGGAASGVLAALESVGSTNVQVHSRSPERAAALCARFAGVARPAESAAAAVHGAEIVINATPVGMQTDEHPVSLDLLDRSAIVLDLVYRRGETTWVRAARERGHRAADGLPMLLAQGALAFERWFGEPPDRDAMRRALER